MKNKFPISIVLLTLIQSFSSCEGVVKGSGKVISALDKSPIDSVQITWRGREAYTNDSGFFVIGEFVGCPLGCPDLELKLMKDGFVSKTVNLTKENDGRLEVKDVTIELIPLNKTLSPQ